MFPERESTRIDAPSELQEAIHSIRTKTGFEQFLLPLTAFAMQKLAGSGAVVVLGNTALRSDAILVQKQKLKSLQLPDCAGYPYFYRGIGHISGYAVNTLATRSAY